MLSLMLVLAMAFMVLPAASFAEEVHASVQEAAQLHKLDTVWAKLDKVEAEAIASGAGRAEVINTVYAAALNLDYVDQDSFSDISKDGFFFTTDGMHCAYNYRLRNEIDRSGNACGQTVITPSNGKNVPLRDATSPNVLLVEPFYGVDGSFTNQYQIEANSIGAATGGEVTMLIAADATGPAIAANYPDKGAVIYDSHGCQSGTSSYLCLTTNVGITQEDYSNGWAVNPGGGEAWIDGRYIQNHITEDLSDPIVWMAICEGMKKGGNGTTGYALLDAGCGCVYGYSQSVTFVGDYAYEGTFWNCIKQGETAADAFSTMVDTHGIHDPYGDAFPILMSEDDPFPANPDSAQTVNCTWTLFGNADPVPLTDFTVDPTDLEMIVGRTATINFNREPSNANAYDLIWTSSDESVAIVKGSRNNRKATVTAAGKGDAVITCTVMVDGEVFGSADINVSVTVDKELCDAANVEGGSLEFGSSEPFGFEPHEEGDRLYVRSTNYHQVNSLATLTTIVNMEAGETLSFEYYYSTQLNKDWYTFTVNDDQLQHLSGINNSWNEYTFTAPEDGIYTFVWAYEKDASTSEGFDRVKIDNVVYSGDPGETPEPEPEPDGDADLNGIIDITDAVYTMCFAMNLDTPTAEQLAHCDMDGNGIIDLTDAIMILQIAIAQ